jgi:hypothetical protein
MTEPATDVRGGIQPADRRRLVIAAVLVLLFATAVVTWRAAREPTAPTVLGRRTAVDFDSDPRPVQSAAGFAGIALPGAGDDEVLRFNGVPTVHFRRNTAAATARVGLCVPAAGDAAVGTGYASDLGTACRELRWVTDGTDLRWVDHSGDRQEYLILLVIPTKPGVATVDRVTYEYQRESGERGLDVGSLDYTVRAT